MSNIASGSRVLIGYVVESPRGVTPVSPTFKTWRCTGTNINLRKTVQTSNEIRGDRQIREARHGFNTVEGTFPFELAMLDYDDQIESQLAGTWAVVTTVSATMSAGSSGTYTRTTGDYIADGFRVGDWVTATGFASPANNTPNVRRVTVVTNTVLTVDVAASVMVTDASSTGRSVSLVGRRIQVGTLLRSWTVERQFVDVARFQPFRGVSFQSLKLSIQPDQLVQGEFGLLGMSSSILASATIAVGVPTPPSDTPPFTSFSGVVTRGTALNTVVTGLDISVDNGRKVQPVVGSRFSPDIFEGTADVTGTLSVLFNSIVEYNDFFNETRAGLYIRLNDVNGVDFHSIHLPLVTFTGGEINPPSEGPCTMQVPFRALVSTVNGLPVPSLSWQRSNA